MATRKNIRTAKKVEEKPQEKLTQEVKPTPEKVVKMEKTPPSKINFKATERRGSDFDVIINGRPRKITRSTYEVLSKDPHRYDIELPKDSPLGLMEVPVKPCKDC